MSTLWNVLVQHFKNDSVGREIGKVVRSSVKANYLATVIQSIAEMPIFMMAHYLYSKISLIII